MSRIALRTVALTGVTAAAILGVGTAALAESGSSTPGAGSQSSSSTHKPAAGKKAGHDRKHQLTAALRRAQHGSIVTKGKDGFVTHTAVRGAVTAVSATSITVKAADGYTERFTLTKATKVREHGAKGTKPTTGTIAQLKSGDKVSVLGKSPDKAGAVPTATIVVDGLRK